MMALFPPVALTSASHSAQVGNLIFAICIYKTSSKISPQV
jgi:uncharacterized MnhB-related membrane protein